MMRMCRKGGGGRQRRQQDRPASSSVRSLSHGEFCSVFASSWWMARVAQNCTLKATLRCIYQ